MYIVYVLYIIYIICLCIYVFYIYIFIRNNLTDNKANNDEKVNLFLSKYKIFLLIVIQNKIFGVNTDFKCLYNYFVYN